MSPAERLMQLSLTRGLCVRIGIVAWFIYACVHGLLLLTRVPLQSLRKEYSGSLVQMTRSADLTCDVFAGGESSPANALGNKLIKRVSKLSS